MSKNGLERRAWQFYTIWDKNQGLKVKIDEVTVDLVPRSGRPAAADRSSSAQKFLWGSMRNFQFYSCNFLTAPHRTGIRQDNAVRDVSNLIWGFASWEAMGSCSKLYCRLAKNGFLVQNRRSQIAKSQIDCMGNRMRIFSHLVFLITFPKIIACSWNSLYRRVSTSATICDKI